MKKMKSIYSLHRKLMIMIIGCISLFAVIASLIFANSFIEDAKKESANNTKHWAELIANTNSMNLVHDEKP